LDVRDLTGTSIPARVGTPYRARLYGYLAVSLAAVIFGMWATAAKLVLNEVHELTIVFYTQLLPGLLLFPVLVRHGFPRAHWRLLLFTSVCGGVIAPILYFEGLGRSTSANAALLSNTESLFTVLLAFMFLRERLGLKGYFSLSGIVVGAFLVSTQLDFSAATFGTYLAGNLLLIAAGFFWAANNNGVAVLSHRVKILPLMSAQMLIEAAILFPIAVAFGAPLVVTGMPAVGLMFLSLVGVASFTVLFYFAFRTIGAMRSGAVLSTSSLWGVLIALAVFPEQGLGFLQAAGGALMVGATAALYLFGEPRRAVSQGEPLSSSGETLKPAGSDEPRSP